MTCIRCEKRCPVGYYVRRIGETTTVHGPWCMSCWVSEHRDRWPTFIVARDVETVDATRSAA